jgi:8-oxo-dGTP pyrophosphatase MutT (NUDIX family)
MKDTTLLFLIKKSQGEVSDICLAMKKRGFGVNRWNGVGGKVEPEKETIEQAVIRESKEEIDVLPQDIKKIAELSFYFSHNPSWDQTVHVYFSENWDGSPKESEEMNPKWFSANELPFENMWPDDPFWLPEVLKGNLLKATFKFGEGDVIKNKEIKIVNKL